MDSKSTEVPETLKKKLEDTIKGYPNFPKQGILFRDIHPLMANPDLRQEVLDLLVERYKNSGVKVVVGMESRGYYFGIPLAFALKVPFVPLRKPNKLPGEVIGVDYGLEYGKDRLEVQTAMINKDDKVVIVDDLLATGGTAEAACKLVKHLEGEIVECAFIIELKDLGGRAKAPEGVKYFSLITY